MQGLLPGLARPKDKVTVVPGNRAQGGLSVAADGPHDEASAEERLARFDTSVPHPARVYDALLGGKDNFAADRATADDLLRAFPAIAEATRSNRRFLKRAVTYLAEEAGIRQFLDIGTGLPSANNTHEVAQRHAPESRVLYVDNDPLVLVHAQALLTSAEPGRTGYVEADLREPRKVLSHAADLLDLSQPVAVMMIAVLHLTTDDDHPHQIVKTYMDATVPGSYLAMTHLADDLNPEMLEAARIFVEQSDTQGKLRGHAEFARFFDGLELIEPGVVPANEWRPHSEFEANALVPSWSGIARKPFPAGQPA
ncbi:MAG: SAM-dependent methyltransferase [Nocardiopsaceae bacterium]|nr:SAM-dependent methyltransferase [Nocardiopsaceae bacterium]